MNLLKPTFLASVIFIVPPLIFLSFGWFEMNSPEWDTNDSGAVQGYALFGFASLAALPCSLLVFPSVAKILGSAFTSRKWVYSNILIVILIAIISAIALSYTMGYTSFAGLIVNAIALTIPLTVIFLVLLAPAMYVWLRVYKSTHNKLSQQDAVNRASA